MDPIACDSGLVEAGVLVVKEEWPLCHEHLHDGLLGDSSTICHLLLLGCLLKCLVCSSGQHATVNSVHELMDNHSSLVLPK